MASDKVVGRRRYSSNLKSKVMAECDAPGPSVAKVAMARGFNANVVHRWGPLAREGEQGTAAKPREFFAVSIAPQVSALGQACRRLRDPSCVAARRR